MKYICVKYDKFLSQTPWIADKSLSAEENDLSRPEQLEKGKTQESWNFGYFCLFLRVFSSYPTTAKLWFIIVIYIIFEKGIGIYKKFWLSFEAKGWLEKSRIDQT